MPQSLLDENFIAALLLTFGLQPYRFSSDEMLLYGKTPDFKVQFHEDRQFYCEVKSIMEDELSHDELADKVHRRIAHKIQEASSQFKSVNFQSSEPNVLALVNHEQLATLGDLLWALDGIHPNLVLPQPYYGHDQINRLLGEYGPVDLFIWVNQDNSHQLLFSQDSPYYNCLCSLFGLEPDKVQGL